jgi:hypothetical protein
MAPARTSSPMCTNAGMAINAHDDAKGTASYFKINKSMGMPI